MAARPQRCNRRCAFTARPKFAGAHRLDPARGREDADVLSIAVRECKRALCGSAPSHRSAPIPATMTTRATLCVLATLCAAATAFVVPTPPITPSTRRAPSPICSEDDPFPERDAEPPRPQTRSSVAPSGAITLSNEVKAILRENNLKDPSEFNQAETDKFVYGAGAGALLVFLLPL